MELSRFNYRLPKESIAQEPLPKRDSSKLLVLDSQSGEFAHYVFRDLPRLLNPGDLVVLNDVKVFPGRIYGIKEQTGGKIECLLLEKRDANSTSELWSCMVKGANRLRKGLVILFDGNVRGVIEVKEDGDRVFIRFSIAELDFRKWL